MLPGMSQMPPPLPPERSPYDQAPPTIPGELSFGPPPPGWPKVVGIISIVWGSLGVICNGCGVASSLSQDAMKNMLPPEAVAQNPQFSQPVSAAQIAVYVFGALLGALLIAAGILCVQRRPLTRPLHLVYGAVSTVVAIIGAFVSWGVMSQMMNSMPPPAGSDPNAAAAQAAGMQMGMIGGLVGGLCFGLAYPVFCLVWFGAVKRTAASLGVAERRELI